ncbi:MAG TPA: DUF3857 domain-containing protein [Flavobacteriaceae bacterium]|nr:DUF3857 domain-containing protein [Flavobacteriaceae bacterium]MCB9213058.1 DUF3857 domain-containing protein [Alteromonas sp.]HPF10963.1 DUF3857 domain-containing protein [Flavobacteriaceae bacterium]HQU20295.1 DUF3857 domain-containing protein [Flavobacteriaceae bacterium]HQU64187.1 DUF3857 domain-containing protein [Flavobacteriaceae bacterium]
MGICLLASVCAMGQRRFKYDVTLSALEANQDDFFVDAPAVILCRNIYFEFGKLLEIRETRKIYKIDGLEYANWELPYNEVKVISATTYNAENGTIKKTSVGDKEIIKDEVTEGKVVSKILFPKVKEGSIVELVYQIEGIGLRTLDYQSSIPIKLFKLVVRNPYAVDIILAKNGYSKVILKTDRIKDGLEYTGLNIPGTEQEVFMGSDENYRGRLYFEYMYDSKLRKFKSWDDIARSFWYDNRSFSLTGYNFSELLKDRNFFKGLVVRLKGNETNPKVIATNLYNHVRDHMEWNNYYNWITDTPKHIYKKEKGSSGEINMILLTLLREAGLEAYPMVVACKHQGIIHFLTKELFNNTIVYLKLQEGYILLDASQKLASFGELPLDLVNGPGLVIYDDRKSEMVSTQVKKTSQINTLVEATLSSDDLSISGTVKNRMSGYYAWGHRQDVEEKKDTKNPYVGPEIAEENDFLSVTNFVQKDLQNLDSPVATYYNFDYQEYLEKIDGKLYFEPLLFFGKKANPFTQEVRIYPLDLGYPTNKRLVIKFAIPSGYEVESVPQNQSIAIRDDIAALSFSILPGEKELQVFFSISINKGVIPEHYYTEMKALFAAYVELSKSKIILKKTSR